MKLTLLDHCEKFTFNYLSFIYSCTYLSYLIQSHSVTNINNTIQTSTAPKFPHKNSQQPLLLEQKTFIYCPYCLFSSHKWSIITRTAYASFMCSPPADNNNKHYTRTFTMNYRTHKKCLLEQTLFLLTFSAISGPITC